MKRRERIVKALRIASEYGMIDGAHHKTWVIDQMVRALTDCPITDSIRVAFTGEHYAADEVGESQEYNQFVKQHNKEEGGTLNSDGWEIGIAP